MFIEATYNDSIGDEVWVFINNHTLMNTQTINISSIKTIQELVRKQAIKTASVLVQFSQDQNK